MIFMPKPIFDSMREEEKPPVTEEEEERKPMTLWDMFMEYTKTKEKGQRKKFLDTVE
jgi:hypothetical protein